MKMNETGRQKLVSKSLALGETYTSRFDSPGFHLERYSRANEQGG